MKKGELIKIETSKTIIYANVVEWNYAFENAIESEPLNLQLTNVNTKVKEEPAKEYKNTEYI